MLTTKIVNFNTTPKFVQLQYSGARHNYINVTIWNILMKLYNNADEVETADCIVKWLGTAKVLELYVTMISSVWAIAGCRVHKQEHSMRVPTLRCSCI